MLTQIKKKRKIVKTISYIKTTACVEATRRCIRMFRLKNMGRETIVTIMDRKVRREGASLLDASGYNFRGRPRFRQTTLETFLASNKTDVI